MRNGGMNAATRNGEFSLNHPIVMVCDGVMLPGLTNAVIMPFSQVDFVPNFEPTVVQSGRNHTQKTGKVKER
jgi:hypothetical protein